MYIGSGEFIQAPHTGDVVKISTLASYASKYVGAVRPYA
jgi:cell wall-associated NlpC family hydrolase